MTDPQNNTNERPVGGTTGRTSGRATGGEQATSGQVTIPGENLVAKIVEKIQDQWLLFLIAIVVLLVGLFLAPASAGSADLRFIVLVIAGLAIAGLLIRVVLTGYQEYLKQPRSVPQSGGGSTIGPVTINDAEHFAVGDGNTLIRNENTPLPATSGAPAVTPQSTTSQSPAPAPSVPSATPQEELAQRQAELASLQQLRNTYGLGQPPDELVSKIAATQQAIQQLKAQLGLD